MPKVKTSEIKDLALDWAVAKCEDVKVSYSKEHHTLLVEGFKHLAWFPSKGWSQGGPIIERELIDLLHVRQNDLSVAWDATFGNDDFVESGLTPLIAAMRVFVASKLGDEVEVPDELA